MVAAAARAAQAARTVARAAAAAPRLSDAERAAWLAQRPFQPIARAPTALSRYPTHDEVGRMIGAGVMNQEPGTRNRGVGCRV